MSESRCECWTDPYEGCPVHDPVVRDLLYECKTADGSGFAIMASDISDAAKLAEDHIAARSSEVVSIVRVKL